MKTAWASLLLFLLSTTVVGAQIKITGRYCVDPYSLFTAENYRKTAMHILDPGQTASIGYNTNSAVWLEVDLCNLSRRDTTVTLTFPNIHIDSIELTDPGGTKLLGDRTDQTGKYITAHSFDLHLPGTGNTRCLFRIKKTISALAFSYQIDNPKQLHADSNRAIWLSFLFCGAALIQLVINVIIFYVNRQRTHLTYAAYVILSVLYVFVATGVGKHLIWPNWLYTSELRIYGASLWFMVLTLFLVQLLSFRVYYPRLYSVVLMLNGLNLLIILTTFIIRICGETYLFNAAASVGYISFFGSISLVLAGLMQHYKKNKSLTIYVLFSFLPHFIWALTIIANVFGLMHSEIHADWLTIIAIYDVLLFGYVLAKTYIVSLRMNRKLNKEIEQERERFTRSLSQVQLRERTHLANILHDKFGSQLTHIMHLIELEKPDEVRQQLAQLTSDVRSMSHRIMPQALNDGALLSAIGQYVSELRANQVIYLSEYDFPELIPVDMAKDFYLILLELVTNAVKHSGASEIHLEFYGHADELVIQVIDNGTGFGDSQEGFGLQSIRSRLLFHHGHLEILSGHGTTIQLLIPWAESQHSRRKNKNAKQNDPPRRESEE